MSFFTVPIAVTKHSSGRFTATEEEQTQPFLVEHYFDYIVNDGPGDLVIGIGESTLSGENLIYLKAGEGIDKFPRACGAFNHRCETPGKTAVFRVLGV